MWIACYDLHGQIFTHVDSRTGVNTVYAVNDIRRACERMILPQVMVSIEHKDALMIAQYRGVEKYRVERAMRTVRWLPLLFAHQSDGSYLLIDGSHTYVARHLLEHKWANAWVVPQEMWCWYLVEGLPQATEAELANSWSGVI